MTGKTGTYHGQPCRLGHGTERYHAGGRCVVCSKELSKARYVEHGATRRARNKEKYEAPGGREYRRERELLRKYGMTTAEYDAMSAAQGGRCAICGEPPRQTYFHVDHDHASGQVRALLCHTCNVGLGSFHDNPVKLEQAAAYLRSFQAARR